MPEPENLRLAFLADLFRENKPIIGATYYYNDGKRLHIREITDQTDRKQLSYKILSDRIWVVK